MWLRKLTILGSSTAVVLPPVLLHAMGWQEGDYLQITVANEREIRLMLLNPTQVTDAMLRTMKEEPVIR